MSRSISSKLAVIAVMCLLAVSSAPAATVKEFYSLPENKQWDYLTQTINEMCAKLQTPLDAKGQRKPDDLLKKQTDFAKFIVKIFDERDRTGLPVYYAKLGSLIYSASLDDPSLPVERVVLVFVTERYKEKLAAKAASGSPATKAK